MERTGKLASGALATILLAIGSHQLGAGEALLRTLERDARTALDRQGMSDIAVAFERAPMRRVALLSGPADMTTRAAALRTVADLPGILTARWVEPKSAAAYGRPLRRTGAAASGCMAKAQAAIAGRSIGFRHGSPWVNPEARQMIARLATAIAPCPEIRIAVLGYADGQQKDAMPMAQARADAVKAMLVSKGIEPGRITATGQNAPSGEITGGDAATRSGRRATIAIEED